MEGVARCSLNISFVQSRAPFSQHAGGGSFINVAIREQERRMKGKKKEKRKEKRKKRGKGKEKKRGETRMTRNDVSKQRRGRVGRCQKVSTSAKYAKGKLSRAGIALKFTSHGFVVARCYQTTDCLENRCPWNVISSPTALFGSQIDKRHADSWGRATFRENVAAFVSQLARLFFYTGKQGHVKKVGEL